VNKNILCFYPFLFDGGLKSVFIIKSKTKGNLINQVCNIKIENHSL
jgi:hypothetical protein